MWFLEHAWIIPLTTFVSFWLILFFGKRLPRHGSEIGIAALAIVFVLALLTAGAWISRDSTQTVKPEEAPAHALAPPVDHVGARTVSLTTAAESGGESG